MTAVISISISLLALAVSGLTAWLTFFRRGALCMTQPTVIYFGHDGPSTVERPILKVHLRTLLYATSKRGKIIEGMYVRLRRDETTQNFNIWVYGDETLNRGSGMFVPDNGVEANHHFLLPRDVRAFQFLAGKYSMEVFATVVAERKSRLLFSTDLEVSQSEAASLQQPRCGLYFDWGPDSARYHSHIQPHPQKELPEFLATVLR